MTLWPFFLSFYRSNAVYFGVSLSVFSDRRQTISSSVEGDLKKHPQASELLVQLQTLCKSLNDRLYTSKPFAKFNSSETFFPKARLALETWSNARQHDIAHDSSKDNPAEPGDHLTSSWILGRMKYTHSIELPFRPDMYIMSEPNLNPLHVPPFRIPRSQLLEKHDKKVMEISSLVEEVFSICSIENSQIFTVNGASVDLAQTDSMFDRIHALLEDFYMMNYDSSKSKLESRILSCLKLLNPSKFHLLQPNIAALRLQYLLQGPFKLPSLLYFLLFILQQHDQKVLTLIFHQLPALESAYHEESLKSTNQKISNLVKDIKSKCAVFFLVDVLLLRISAVAVKSSSLPLNFSGKLLLQLLGEIKTHTGYSWRTRNPVVILSIFNYLANTLLVTSLRDHVDYPDVSQYEDPLFKNFWDIALAIGERQFSNIYFHLILFHVYSKVVSFLGPKITVKGLVSNNFSLTAPSVSTLQTRGMLVNDLGKFLIDFARKYCVRSDGFWFYLIEALKYSILYNSQLSFVTRYIYDTYVSLFSQSPYWRPPSIPENPIDFNVSKPSALILEETVNYSLIGHLYRKLQQIYVIDEQRIVDPVQLDLIRYFITACTPQKSESILRYHSYSGFLVYLLSNSDLYSSQTFINRFLFMQPVDGFAYPKGVFWGILKQFFWLFPRLNDPKHRQFRKLDSGLLETLKAFVFRVSTKEMKVPSSLLSKILEKRPRLVSVAKIFAIYSYVGMPLDGIIIDLAAFLHRSEEFVALIELFAYLRFKNEACDFSTFDEKLDISEDQSVDANMTLSKWDQFFARPSAWQISQQRNYPQLKILVSHKLVPVFVEAFVLRNEWYFLYDYLSLVLEVNPYILSPTSLDRMTFSLETTMLTLQKRDIVLANINNSLKGLSSLILANRDPVALLLRKFSILYGSKEEDVVKQLQSIFERRHITNVGDFRNFVCKESTLRRDLSEGILRLNSKAIMDCLNTCIDTKHIANK